MPYNEELEMRINKIVSKWKNIAAKKMFGGICHLIDGNMFGGVHKDFLILRGSLGFKFFIKNSLNADNASIRPSWNLFVPRSFSEFSTDRPASESLRSISRCSSIK